MKPWKVAALYLIVPALTVSYELSIRIFDTGNSEFAGMLSSLVTLPSFVVVLGVGAKVFGARPGDSNLAFVAMFLAAALMNAALIYGAAKSVTGKAR